MGTDKDAYAALDEWKARLLHNNSGAPYRNCDDGFVAGYEAGIEKLRAAVLKLWDENDGWIAGADYRRLAAVLGVPPERVQSYRQGGQSRPAQSMRSKNIPMG